MFCRSERFHENVCGLLGGRDILKVSLSRSISFTNIVKTSINVFRASMFDVVLDMLKGGFGICIDRQRKSEFEADRSGEFVQKYCFFGCFGELHIFGFHGRYGDN